MLTLSGVTPVHPGGTAPLAGPGFAAAGGGLEDPCYASLIESRRKAV
jgi:hypothetical protein